MTDYPSWSQRKAWNNDGMDPDWRPDPLPQKIDKFECKKCGQNLYESMIKAWPETRISILSQELPKFPPNNQITIPIEQLKQFNAQFRELGEFVAWVCGVKIEDLCRFNMMEYIQKRNSQK